ncbi:hypothetical protein BT63DRAFT_169554 [Microthyrium microscopicum]|uniref:Uncharacterized protein n=1 Tax=Microthyrium microscopicum TaxID=703497 RepID=A0A6A6UNS8_9PEZI|nr:hypothetical protein BT63DRAFT_169554 [Microthyrium microscopicum]
MPPKRSGPANESGETAPRKSTRAAMQAAKKEAEAAEVAVKTNSQAYQRNVLARSKKIAQRRQLSKGMDSKQDSPESEATSSNPGPNGSETARGKKKKDPNSIKIPAGNLSSSGDGNSANIDDDPLIDTVSALPKPLDMKGPTLSTMEFIIPVPFVSQSGGQYQRMITDSKDLIEAFTASRAPTSDMVQKASDFVESMRDICLHLDFVQKPNLDFQGGEVEPSQQASYDRSISYKFQLLSDIFTALKDQGFHIVIFAKTRHLNLVRVFVKGSNNVAKSNTTVTILSSTDFESDNLPSANLMITLDNEMDIHASQVHEFRQQDAYLVPIISFVIKNTIDHIDQTMKDSVNATELLGVEKLQHQVACIAKLRDHAKLSTSKLNTPDKVQMPIIAELVADFVKNKTDNSEWAILPIGPLDDTDSYELANGNVVLETGGPNNSEEVVDGQASEGAKRKRSSEDTGEDVGRPTKKQVFTGHDDCVKRESVLSQQITRLKQELSGVRKEMTGKFAEQTELREIIAAKDAHIHRMENDWNDTIEKLHAKDRAIAQHEKDAAKYRDDLEKSLDVRRRRDEQNSLLRSQMEELTAQRDEARQKLESSEIPEIAEMQRLTREKEEAEAAQVKAEKRFDSSEQQAAYLRDQYQQNSIEAMKLTEENDELKAKNKDLARKASGEARMLREATNEGIIAQHLELKKEMEAEIVSLKAAVAAQELELQKKRSGVNTRAQSVPRSPRCRQENKRARQVNSRPNQRTRTKPAPEPASDSEGIPFAAPKSSRNRKPAPDPATAPEPGSASNTSRKRKRDESAPEAEPAPESKRSRTQPSHFTPAVTRARARRLAAVPPTDTTGTTRRGRNGVRSATAEPSRRSARLKAT